MKINRQFCVAPMMDWTDRHCRYFMRLIASTRCSIPRWLPGAIIYGDTHHHLQMDPFEHPVALQLGGSDPKDLAKACQMARIMTMPRSTELWLPSDRFKMECSGR